MGLIQEARRLITRRVKEPRGEPVDLPQSLLDAPVADQKAWRFVSKEVANYRTWKPFNNYMFESYIDNQIFGLYVNVYVPNARSERVKEILLDGMESLLQQREKAKGIEPESPEEADWLTIRSNIVREQFMAHFQSNDIPTLLFNRSSPTTKARTIT